MSTNKIVGELLTLLERRESELLEWGFYEVAHSAEEIADLFSSDERWGEDFQTLAGTGGETLFIDDLASSNLLYRLPESFPVAYRSRFAESVRLMARLRQRFRPDDWTHAPELVSQTRLHLAPRRFPKRTCTSADVWKVVEDATWSSQVQRAALDSLCAMPDGPLRLAAFQVRATNRILRHYQGSDAPTGTVVTAGTGGGKTKSFYIPAFMGIAADVARDGLHTTKVLAIYPRNVLLADQFGEATAQAMLVNSALARMLKRPIRVGALVGEVPLNADFEHDQRNKFSLSNWIRSRHCAGHVVPHLRHPTTGEGLVWLDVERVAGKSTLRTDNPSASVVFPDGLVCLTREDLVARPPDIFLTSIEMLNKELSAEVGREVLGFGKTNSTLRLVLLDEIHTYEGITGAQVPWILRRLAFWTRTPNRGDAVHYVGLSATLQDAPNHLAMLTGVSDTMIEEVFPEPSDTEISVEGNEYNVVLKSHPGSGAGVLATSIQAVMLGARLLTPSGHHARSDSRPDPGYFFGRKVFGFTDNLDVVNRWLPNFIDAERVKRLARLRAGHDGDSAQDAAGQIWRLSEALGHDLNNRLSVDRISSQDPGVEAHADVILATSSLEVGFDDPDVGMVLQHKAPRSAASFLQRKGRGGRRMGVRPWTVVVLSDHGRDRWAFRDSERLFSPVLERLLLPVFNPYVLRIQATWFLVDWIADKVARGIPSLYLSRARYSDARAETVVETLLSDPAKRDELARDMSRWIRTGSGGFRVGDPGALARDILWSPPRAVLRHVVPELYKQMSNGYPASVDSQRPRLLPKFLPATTWDVLDAQDVELKLPRDISYVMDADRALREMVPGRVSRRHAVNPNEPSKWLSWSMSLLTDPSPTQAPVDSLFASWIRVDDVPDVALYQPTLLTVDDVPNKVKNSSNATWSWNISLRRVGVCSNLDLHTGPTTSRLFSASCAWLHREHSHLRVFRYSSEFNFDIHLDRDIVRRGILKVSPPASQVDDRTVAIGYGRAVDALEFPLVVQVAGERPAFLPEMRRGLLPLYFRYRVARSAVLRTVASGFSISLFCTSALGMVTATALRNRVELASAWDLIPDKGNAARKVLQTVLSSEAAHDGDGNRRIREVVELWNRPEVLSEVDRLLKVLWSPPDQAFEEWLKETFVETIRAAIETAVHTILPEVPDKDVRVDVVREGGAVSLVISENDAGGVGVIERFLTELTSHPGLLDSAVRSALTDCPNERLNHMVLNAVRIARPIDSDMNAAFDRVRNARGYQDVQEAKDALISELEHAGCQADKEGVTALLGKALLPGSNRGTDRWLDGLTRARERASERLGIAVDVRLFGYWLLQLHRPQHQMNATLMRITGEPTSPSQLFHAFNRLTLEPCHDTCPECLGTMGEMDGLMPSRRLALHWLGLDSLDLVINVDDSGSWLAKLDSAMSTSERLRLRHSTGQRSEVAKQLAARLAVEVDRGFSTSAFRIAEVRRYKGGWETHVHLDDLEMT